MSLKGQSHQVGTIRFVQKVHGAMLPFLNNAVPETDVNCMNSGMAL